MSDNTNPNPCGSTGSWVERPLRLRPAVRPARQHRRPGQHRRQAPNASRAAGPGAASTSRQESEHSGNRRVKWSKVGKGMVKQRHARRFCTRARQPRATNSLVPRRLPTVQANQRERIQRLRAMRRRMQVVTENTLNRHNIILTQLTSLETLRHELESRMEGVVQALSTVVDDPSNALPRIAAAADAQVVVMKKLVQLLRRIDDSGLVD